MKPVQRLVQLSLQRRHRSGRLSGFTLMELVMGSLLTVVVVTTLGALALMAELRLGQSAEVSQSLRESWGRTLEFISDEAQNAYWIRSDTASAYPSGCNGGVAPSNLLVLEGPPNPSNPTTPLWQVVYGVRSNPGTGKWRGFNLLVRCGPPFQATVPATTNSTQREVAALGGNLDLAAANQESVITDQLAKDNPFQVVLYDNTSGRDRNARVSLFLGRAQGQTYPPADTFDGYHTQIRASRNPGFDWTGNPACATTTNATTGNQEPPNTASCKTIPVRDSLLRRGAIKEYNLPATGTFVVNRCGRLNDGCEGPASIENTDVVFLRGRQADFTRKFDNIDTTLPCGRTRCYLSNGSQSVTIYDGDVLVFYDRVMHL